MTGPKQVTEKQLAANRRNAQLSTGPRTPEGKAVSRWNALTHGILAQAVIPPPLDEIEPLRVGNNLGGIQRIVDGGNCLMTIIANGLYYLLVKLIGVKSLLLASRQYAREHRLGNKG